MCGANLGRWVVAPIHSPCVSPDAYIRFQRPPTELQPVANKLSTIMRCLNEVLKFGSVGFTDRDLYPYQLALAQIENMRVDGKFVGRDGSLPEGQAVLNANLGESYEMIQVRHGYSIGVFLLC